MLSLLQNYEKMHARGPKHNRLTIFSMQTLFYDPHGTCLPLPLSKTRSVPCILLSHWFVLLLSFL